MNKDLFFKQIEENLDCDQVHLDMAVNRGLIRARNDRVDPKKLLKLAIACVFTVTMCFILTMEPFRMTAEAHYRNWNEAFPGSSEILAGYFDEIANNVLNILGGEL